MNREEKELVVGRQAVLASLRNGKVLEVYLSDGQKGRIVNEILNEASRKKVSVKTLSREEFRKNGGAIPGNQGFSALVPPYSYSEIDRLVYQAKGRSKYPFLIMFDHLEDPHNLGAVLRTADAAGVDGVIIPEQRSVRINATVRKVSCGAAERLPVAMVGNLNRTADFLKKEGFWLYGAEADGEKPYYRADYCRPLVLVVGSEGKGISQLTRKQCDVMLSIPMPGTEAGSLNVSAASAVLIYAALAQRERWLS